MSELLHSLLDEQANATPRADAIVHGDRVLSYEGLAQSMRRAAGGLIARGLEKHDRVAIYLPKRPETVAAIFGTVFAGGVFVPINPLLKPAQVGHILRDCGVRILVTSVQRAEDLHDQLLQCADLHTVVLIDPEPVRTRIAGSKTTVDWARFQNMSDAAATHRVIDLDMAAILYTSGSTGSPKGVVLSHRNIVAGARSVSAYLENRPSDRILAVLPLSFDAGFSQLTTAFATGACAVLMDYLLPRDVVKAAERYGATGLAGVPPLWYQLARMSWPETVRENLRYITNTGGAMPRPTLNALRSALPRTRVFLMYGLTEAFRSTFLPPEEVDRRPDSIGKAIPNAEILVVREDGTSCDADEPGELVHRGSLVAMGYWNDAERTALRFRAAPDQPSGLPMPEIAVWSGDTVRRDSEGFLFFVGRRDEMIKTSGYRVSPNEIEDVVYATGLVGEAAACGIPHPELGQAILVAVTMPDSEAHLDRVFEACRRELPNFMVPARIEVIDELPRGPNGKIDRKAIAARFRHLFTAEEP